MSNALFILLIPLLLMLSSLHSAMAAGRCLSSRLSASAPSTSMPPLPEYHRNYVKMNPRLYDKRHVFHGKQVKNYKPKGFRHSSAPSRYTNYRPSCFKQPLSKPWTSTEEGGLKMLWCLAEWRWEGCLWFPCSWGMRPYWGRARYYKLPPLLEVMWKFIFIHDLNILLFDYILYILLEVSSF